MKLSRNQATGALYGAELSHVHHEGFGDFARGAAPGIVAHLRAEGVTSGRVLDVGCGSGILARALLDASYAVTGIDISPAMIDLAREMAPEADFIIGDVATAELPPCDAVIAIAEVLAYESERPVDLPGTFRRFAAAIRPGGVLILDLLLQADSAPMSYRGSRAGDHWRVDVEVSEDVERSVVTRRIHTEVERDGSVRRSDEVHHVRTFDRTQVIGWLEAAGFQVQTGSAYGDHPMLERRLAFFARRAPAGELRPSD